MPLKLGEYMQLGMKIRVMVQARIDKKTGLPNGYYDFIPASIKPAMDQREIVFASPALANALLLAKGAKNHQEAMNLLTQAKAPKECVLALFQAHLDGKVDYPI